MRRCCRYCRSCLRGRTAFLRQSILMHAMFRACAQAQGDAHNRERSAASFISSRETDLSRFSASLCLQREGDRDHIILRDVFLRKAFDFICLRNPIAAAVTRNVHSRTQDIH